MNYRHAFHAGNHTEVFKHAVLAILVCRLLKKSRPFAVIDTHAGIGVYDLTSEQARKTNEALSGIGKIFYKSVPSAEAYLRIVRSLNQDGLTRYPGSPAIIRSLLRPHTDRLVANELHDEDAVHLRSAFRGDKQVLIHNRDGYEAMLAFVPPLERRGLVFVDPPFESKAEFETLAAKLIAAYRKWPTGIFAVWYPIKDRDPSRRFLGELRASGILRCLSAEFLLYPMDGAALAGSGILIINPPWLLDQEIMTLCVELTDAFEASEGRWSVEWISQA
ncbi:MAG TPA: 23S rRNA (adenine(2030)-N(6))-methyltransferase RlmJ [Rhizomicrobium sp.]|nr:23S rRNA (adenine(2030)-N(6))-methyltransferase RlmJ [Rhizomicrobium sp.]